MAINGEYFTVEITAPLEWFAEIENELGIKLADLDEDVLSELMSYLVGYGANAHEDLVRIIGEKVEDNNSVYVGKFKMNYDEFAPERNYIVQKLTDEENIFEFIGCYNDVKSALKSMESEEE